MIRQPISWRWHLGLGIASILCLIALYSYISARASAANENQKMVPGWEHLYHNGLVRVFTPDESAGGDILLWADTKNTLGRLLGGLAIAIAVGLLLGLAMGCYAPVEAFFLPPLTFLAKIPPTAMLGVFFVMFGVQYQFYVSMIVFGLVPTLAQTIYHAAKDDVPEEILFKARTLGASQFQCIWDVILMHILPKVIETVRLYLGPAMVYLLAAENLIGDDGFGCRIRQMARRSDMSVVFVYLIFLGAGGLVIDSALRWIQRKLCPWYSH